MVESSSSPISITWEFLSNACSFLVVRMLVYVGWEKWSLLAESPLPCTMRLESSPGVTHVLHSRGNVYLLMFPLFWFCLLQNSINEPYTVLIRLLRFLVFRLRISFSLNTWLGSQWNHSLPDTFERIFYLNTWTCFSKQLSNKDILFHLEISLISYNLAGNYFIIYIS